MKKLLLTLLFLLAPTAAWAQCNGVFPANTVCGNASGASNTPRPTSPAGFQGAAGGSNGQVQYNNSGTLAGVTVSCAAGQAIQVINSTVTCVSLTIDPPQGRLTLASGVPVMGPTSCAGVACNGKSTIFYDCYVGCNVPSYNGTNFVAQTIAGGEVSDTMPTLGTGVTNSADVFDIWWTSSGAICHATNGSGAGWSGDTGGSVTARGTGYTQLARVSGILVNANTITHCYNGSTDLGPISANRVTYLGTTLTGGSAGITSFLFGSATAGGGIAVFGLWNYYNRVTVTTNVTDNTSYNYTTATWRQAGGSAGNAIRFVLGVAEDNITASYITSNTLVAAANANTQTAIGFDSTSGPQCLWGLTFSQAASTMGGTPTTVCNIFSPVGVHNIYAIEKSDGTNANTFNASSANSLGASLRM